jgi:hypothetical protein
MATTKKTAAPAKPAAELRVYLTLTDLQPQFSSWMSSPLGARGYVAMQGTHALLVEIAPGLSIQRVIDLALKAEPTLEPGILAVERQFGVKVNFAGLPQNTERYQERVYFAVEKALKARHAEIEEKQPNIFGRIEKELFLRTIDEPEAKKALQLGKLITTASFSMACWI